MKRAAILSLSLMLIGFALAQASAAQVQTEASIQVFWERFKAAVIKGDKGAVADLSQFPIAMPYGMRVIKNRVQLIKRYREVFDSEANAAECFREARPETEKEKPNEFSVVCKNAAGHEVVIYSFGRTRNGWRFKGLDNLNE